MGEYHKVPENIRGFCPSSELRLIILSTEVTQSHFCLEDPHCMHVQAGLEGHAHPGERLGEIQTGHDAHLA